MSEEKKISLEDRFDRLDDIISQMEDGSIGLDKSFELYKKGMEQMKAANQALDQIEKAMLVMNESGQIAFKSFLPADGIWGSSWIGFRNFVDFFQSFYFGELLRNTIFYSLLKLVISVPLSIILAVTSIDASKHQCLTTTTQIHHLTSIIVEALKISIWQHYRRMFTSIFSHNPILSLHLHSHETKQS